MKTSLKIAGLLTTAFALPAFYLVTTTGAFARDALSSEQKAELQRLLAVPANSRLASLDRHEPPRNPRSAFDRLLMWNEVLLDTLAIDHTPGAAFGSNVGPHRSSRAVAITQIAVFDAVNAITRKFQPYNDLGRVDDASLDTAIAQSAHDVLVALYPLQQARLDAILATDLTRISGSARNKSRGIALGAKSAQVMLARRAGDGSEVPEQNVGTGPDDYHLDIDPATNQVRIGKWSVDPVTPSRKIALGSHWGSVKPFVMTSGSQFRPPVPPSADSAAYAAAYNEVKDVGADGVTTPTNRTDAQTFIGNFWGYDGTPNLCAPPRLYNMVARAVALQQGMHNVSEMARFLAVLNTAIGDAGIGAWDAKWFYEYWRPVTGIRAGDVDGNPATTGNPTWQPYGAPLTNTSGPNFTPPFPAYPSGHATFGGAVFEVLRSYFPNNTAFDFVSDEYNGQNKDVNGNVRPLVTVHFNSLSQAEQENAKSRIYNGVHWQFDADSGIEEGNKTADYVLAHAFQRKRGNYKDD